MVTSHPPVDAKPDINTFCAAEDSGDFFGCYARATAKVKVGCSNPETPVAMNCGCMCSSSSEATDQTAMGSCRTIMDRAPGSPTHGLPVGCQARCVDQRHTAFVQATCSDIV